MSHPRRVIKPFVPLCTATARYDSITLPGKIMINSRNSRRKIRAVLGSINPAHK